MTPTLSPPAEAVPPSPPAGLEAVPVRSCVRVTGLDSSPGIEADLRRLRALGVCEGRHVEVLKTGDPMIVRVFGTRLGVARSLASRVRVEPCGRPSCRQGGARA